MIDLNKKYKTRSGYKVILHGIVLFNSVGGKVSYPVKGVVIVKDKPRKTTMMIWSEEGLSDIVWGSNKGFDLVEDNS